jgi:hypothetical protein
MTAPEEVVTWFGWNNSETAVLLPQWWPITLERAINTYKEQDEIGIEPWQWQPGWVPILAGSQWVIVNCSDLAKIQLQYENLTPASAGNISR